MRVLMVSKALVVGSYQSKLQALASHPDVELTLVAPPYWRDAGRVLRYEPLYTRGYLTLLKQQRLNGHYHLHWYPGLTDLVRRVQPDLVHIDEEPADVVAWQCQRAANLAGARSVFFTWQNILRPVPLPFRAFQRYVFDNADVAICGNREAARVVRAKGYRKAIALIPQFGVDERAFRPADESAARRRLRVGFAGRLVPEKGADLLLRALPKLDRDVELVVQGSGPAEACLRRLAGELKLEDRVTFLPHRPSREMPAFYQSVDVIALPSRTRPNWKEQWGRVVMEAMSCAVPVVVSSSGELPNVADDAGLVVPEGDVEALGAALRRLFDDAGLRRQLGERGRERVLRHYTQQAVADATYGAYRRVLGH